MADEKPHSGKPPDAGPVAGKPAFDPFHADTPVLPGVPQKGAAPAAAGGFKLDFKDPKVMAGGGVGLAILALLSWMMLGPSETPAPTASGPVAAESAPAAASAPATSSAPPTPEPPALQVVAVPGAVGTVEEFPQAWSTKKVLLQRPTGRVPALIIRLPGGSPRRADTYWGLLLMSPYGRCELAYLTDLKKIADDYGYRARHPMVVDPCNLTVFDPTRLGDIGGIVARGAVVQGTTLRPPLSMELKIEGGRIMVVQTE